MPRTVRILGTRGVPSRHGGFETAAQNVGGELVRRGWRVVVYCQDDEIEAGFEDTWEGVERVHFPGRLPGAVGTMWFDQLATRHAARHADPDREVCLVLGYNTAFLNGLLRRRGIPTVVNMDGIEWQRDRWSRGQRLFLRANERLATRWGDRLIADHPEIARHLAAIAPEARITMIPYGAPSVEEAPTGPLGDFDVKPREYLTLIARPVPENSVLSMVRGFSARSRGVQLLVLGRYDSNDPYHRAVRAAASDEVLFPGAVYEPEVVGALRYHSRAYLHGHTVGGTNPSLVEALGCGNPVIAHDNRFNRWVAQEAGRYFTDETEFGQALDEVLGEAVDVEAMSRRARSRHEHAFTWAGITDQYESVLLEAAAGA